MKVYALIGKSGTGKSYQAINLCRKKSIEAIIDDGLFIYNGKAMAGKSAKKEATKIGAVRRAIFNDEAHRDDVRKKIQSISPNSILIIGTSDDMVHRIAKRLGMKEIDEKIYIDDITSENDRRLAQKYRNTMGQHVIPVSAMQIKKEFSGYMLNPMRLFKGFGNERSAMGEKSVVRPTYSYLGKFAISDRVIGDIVRCTAKDIDGIVSVGKINTNDKIEALDVNVVVNVSRKANILDIGRRLQEKSVKMIEEMTAFHINELNIEVRGRI